MEKQQSDALVERLAGVLANDQFGGRYLHTKQAKEAARALLPVVEQEIAAARAEHGERIAQAIEGGYLGADFGRGFDGRESPDAALHHAYDEGLEHAARIARTAAQTPATSTEEER